MMFSYKLFRMDPWTVDIRESQAGLDGLQREKERGSVSGLLGMCENWSPMKITSNLSHECIRYRMILLNEEVLCCDEHLSLELCLTGRSFRYRNKPGSLGQNSGSKIGRDGDELSIASLQQHMPY